MRWKYLTDRDSLRKTSHSQELGMTQFPLIAAFLPWRSSHACRCRYDEKASKMCVKIKEDLWMIKEKINHGKEHRQKVNERKRRFTNNFVRPALRLHKDIVKSSLPMCCFLSLLLVHRDLAWLTMAKVKRWLWTIDMRKSSISKKT